MSLRIWCLAHGLLLGSACRGFHEPLLVASGDGEALPQVTRLAEAPIGFYARHASIVRQGGATWVAWETTLEDRTDTTLQLFHNAGSPFRDPWSSVVVKHTDGPTRPSLAPSPDGLLLLSNHCPDTCPDHEISHGHLERYPVDEPLRADAVWSLPLDTSDAGRGKVATATDPSSGEVVPGEHVAACYSDNRPDVEQLRCDRLVDGDWAPALRLESGANADHPSVLLDPNDGLVVGFAGRVDGRREAQIRFDDDTLLRLSPDVQGGEVHLARGGGSLHAVWRTRRDGLWQLHYGVCGAYPDCVDLDAWAIEQVAEAGELSGIGILAEREDVVLVWSEAEAEGPLGIQLAWVCPEGLALQALAEGASTNQGQPSLVIHERELVVAYTALATEAAPSELRLARVRRSCR